MNYKDVVDRIRQVVFDHKMLVDFGYGQLSDIKTRAQGDGLDGDTNDADYPYCFLNPQPHVRTETQITYNFNMILMDMAREEEGDDYQNFLAIQSDCIQYIDDIVARLYYHYKDQPEVQFNYSYNPFYERFQDQLAGATANLSIIVPTNINDCITPFADYELVHTKQYGEEGSSATFNYNQAGFGSGYNATQGQYRIDWRLTDITNNEVLAPIPATVGLAYAFNGVAAALGPQQSIPPFPATWSRSGTYSFTVPAGETFTNPSFLFGLVDGPIQFTALGYNNPLGSGVPYLIEMKIYKRQ